MNETQIKGLTTELQCQLYFTQLGYNVLIPISQDCRYDMIVDIDGFLARIQIKTCREISTGIKFNVYSSGLNHSEGNTHRAYTKEEIDFFATYWNNNIYLVPVELCGVSEKVLSFEKIDTASNQLLLKNCLAEKIINQIKNGVNLQTIQEENKIILQYDLKGNFIKSFSTISEACRELGKTGTGCVSHISEVIRGKRKTAYGYVWKINNLE